MGTGMGAKKMCVSALHIKKGFARGDGDKYSLNTDSVQMCPFQTVNFKVLSELGEPMPGFCDSSCSRGEGGEHPPG